MNEGLRQQQLALPPVFELSKRLEQIPGVLGVGIGFRFVRGQRTEDLAFTVDVLEKLPLSRITTAHHIPREFAGVPIDVRPVQRWRDIIDQFSEDLDIEFDTMPGGASISHYEEDGERGTLGCFATLRSDSNVVVLLTNHHTVYPNPNSKGPGLHVGQPRISSTRCCKTGVIAKVLDGVRGPLADAAIAKLNGKRPFVQKLPGVGPDKDGKNEDLIVGVPDEITVAGIKTAVLCGETVRKLGRSTGVTEGRVVSINATHPSGRTDTMYRHQIIIEPTKGGVVIGSSAINFGVEGDSGAVVINEWNQVVGLLHASQVLDQVAWDELSQPADRTYTASVCSGAALNQNVGRYGSASPIHAVLDLMKIEILKSKNIVTSSTPSGPTPPTPPPGPVVPTGALLPGMEIVKRPLDAADLLRSAVLDEVIERLFASPLGRKIMELYELHGPQARELLDHDRRAKIAWHRNHGPAFAAKLLANMESLDQPLPQQIEGLALDEMRRRVCGVFLSRGTSDFAAAGERYLPIALELLRGARTIREALDRVRAHEGVV